MKAWCQRIGWVVMGLVLAVPGVGAEDGEAGKAGWLAPLPDGIRLDLPPLDSDVPAPAVVLGAPLGTRFSRWEEARRYLEALAESSERVSIRPYGETYERRPLWLVAVTSEANQERLDEIRRDRLRLADPRALEPAERERLERDTPAVVWLGYGIHGNETSSTEAALATAYVLAAAQGEEWAERLSKLVVLIDPLQNPDGRERYLAAYQQRRGREPNPQPDAAEHREPWPGGRGNHYLFDLNRDWAWATQKETRHRLTEYRRWEPQVFVDLHEMSARSEYFFPPPTEPVHAAISPQVLRWLDRFGRANAAAFDRAGWLYFKAEAFDLFYPGYGDSYPSLRGAVGMTYEVGGGGRAGEALTLADGSVLTLADRLARHLTASLATVAAAARGHAELNRDFATSRTPETGQPATYLWSADQAEALALVELLRVHGVEVGRLDREQTLTAGAVGSRGERGEVRLPAGTWAVSTRQPLGRLVRALLEPDPDLPAAWVEQQRRRAEQNLDAEFFDVTAWSPLFAFGLEAWVHGGVPDGLEMVSGEIDPEIGPQARAGASAEDAPADGAREPVGYLLPWHGLAGYRTAVRLLGEEIPVRLVRSPVQIADGAVDAGSLFVPRAGAPSELRDRLVTAAGQPGATALRPVWDSFGELGTSLGSDRVVRLVEPRVGLLAGDAVSVTSFAALWALFDRLLEAPVARLDLDRFTASGSGRQLLGGLDVVVMPDGDYSELAAGEAPGNTAGDTAENAAQTDAGNAAGFAAELATWVRDGGVLVAVGEAQRWLSAHGLSAVEVWPPPEGEGSAGGRYATPDPEHRGDEGAEGYPAPPERRLLDTPGAVVATRLSPGHPLGAGLPAPPPVLLRGDTVWRATGDPQQDVLTVREVDPVLAGFTWPEAREHLSGSLLVASESVGEGRVVLFAQDPAFRGFWRATMPLLLNAVLYGPSGGLDPAGER